MKTDDFGERSVCDYIGEEEITFVYIGKFIQQVNQFYISRAPPTLVAPNVHLAHNASTQNEYTRQKE